MLLFFFTSYVITVCTGMTITKETVALAEERPLC